MYVCRVIRGCALLSGSGPVDLLHSAFLPTTVAVPCACSTVSGRLLIRRAIHSGGMLSAVNSAGNGLNPMLSSAVPPFPRYSVVFTAKKNPRVAAGIQTGVGTNSGAG